LIAQETPVCPEGSTDLDEREDRVACSKKEEKKEEREKYSAPRIAETSSY
jgi:hypothetical protein